mgnify:CR=1 FL=1
MALASRCFCLFWSIWSSNESTSTRLIKWERHHSCSHCWSVDAGSKTNFGVHESRGGISTLSWGLWGWINMLVIATHFCASNLFSKNNFHTNFGMTSTHHSLCNKFQHGSDSTFASVLWLTQLGTQKFFHMAQLWHTLPENWWHVHLAEWEQIGPLTQDIWSKPDQWDLSQTAIVQWQSKIVPCRVKSEKFYSKQKKVGLSAMPNKTPSKWCQFILKWC